MNSAAYFSPTGRTRDSWPETGAAERPHRPAFFRCGFSGGGHLLVTMTLAANSVDDDAALLREYAQQRSEAAFAELVRRHVNLVYSAALRQVGGDAAAAQDVTQGVFTELARQAGRLTRHPALTGWLYTTTRRLAAHAVRGETRRQRREQEAHMMQELLREPSSAELELDWERVRPVLDAAMHDLGETDRLAVLLRHFEQRPLAEVGVRLGLSENAARMRVDRALDKLRAKLAKRGVTSTSAALAVALAGPAATAAPAALASTITTAVLAATAVTAVLAAAGTAFVLQHQTGERLRMDNADLQQRVAQLTEAVQAARQASTPVTPEPERPRETPAELLRLRGEVARLKNQALEQKASATTDHKEIPPVMPDRLGEPFVVGGDFVPLNQIGNAGQATPEATAMTTMWALQSRNLELLKQTKEPPSEEFKQWLAVKDPRLLDEQIMLERTAILLQGVEAIQAKVLKESSEKPDEVNLELAFKRHPLIQGVQSLVMPLKFSDGTWRVSLPAIPSGQP